MIAVTSPAPIQVSVSPTGQVVLSTTPTVLQVTIRAAVILGPGGGTTIPPSPQPLVLTAGGPNQYDPAPNQSTITLPSATARYLIFQGSAPLYPGIHYSRSGALVSLLTGHISPDDIFLLCEYY